MAENEIRGNDAGEEKQKGGIGQMYREHREKQKQKKAQKPKKSVGQEILSWVLTILAALAIAFLVRTFLFEPVKVDGSSMDDTLANGEIMFVGKTSYGSRWLTLPFVMSDEQKEAAPKFSYFGNPPRFDVAICRYPHRGDVNFVKRVVGLPGDTVELKNGYLYVNGEKYDEPYINDDYRSGAGKTFAATRVPKQGDKVTLQDGAFTVDGEDYSFGFTLLRVKGGDGEWRIRRVYGASLNNMWAEKDGKRYLLYNGVWYREISAEKAEAGSPMARYQYPNEPAEEVTLAVCDDSPMADGEYTVAADYYFMMGDHRNNSNDSRSVGAVERTYVIGAVRRVILPFKNWRGIQNGLNVK